MKPRPIDWAANREDFLTNIRNEPNRTELRRKVERWVQEKTHPLTLRLMLTMSHEKGIYADPRLDPSENSELVERKQAFVLSEAWEDFRASAVALLIRLATTQGFTQVDMVLNDFMWQIYYFTTCERTPADLQRWLDSMKKTFVQKKVPEPWRLPRGGR